jgi:hypothetical membrane protein
MTDSPTSKEDDTMTASTRETADPSKLVAPAAYAAGASVVAQLLLLGSLHVLSPEFEPAWRVISEYANGDHGWVLSLSFVAGACGAWALAVAIWSQVRTTSARVGLVVLLVAGLGQALAAIFDINHPLHNMAGFLGTLGFAIAAVLIGVALSRTEPWARPRKALLWTAQLPWIALFLFIATTVLLVVTFAQAGGEAPPDGQALSLGTALPDGTIAVNGWFNRLIIIAGAVWIVTIAWHSVSIRGRRS